MCFPIWQTAHPDCRCAKIRLPICSNSRPTDTTTTTAATCTHTIRQQCDVAAARQMADTVGTSSRPCQRLSRWAHSRVCRPVCCRSRRSNPVGASGCRAGRVQLIMAAIGVERPGTRPDSVFSAILVFGDVQGTKGLRFRWLMRTWCEMIRYVFLLFYFYVFLCIWTKQR